MNKLYDKIIWNNNTTPALNDANLNKMSKAIDDIDDRVVELAADIFVNIPQIQAYLDQAEDLYEAMVLLSQNPPYIGQNGNWWVWSTSAGDFVDSGIDASITVQIADITMLEPNETPYVENTGTNTDPVFHLFIPRGQTGADGEDGVSPEVTITTITGGHKVNITDADHPSGQDFDVMDGEDGQDGTDGQDGVSPLITVTDITGGHRVTIFDADHPSGQSFNVMDGSGNGDMCKSVYDTDDDGKVDNAEDADTVNGHSVNSDVPSNAVFTDTWNALVGATAQANGTAGYAPQPLIADKDKFLKGDGTWDTPSSGGSNVSVGHTGAASSTGVRKQQITVDNVATDIDGTLYMEQTITLSTSASVTATFTNSAITSDSKIEAFAGRSTGDVSGAQNDFPYESVYTDGTNHQYQITFPKFSSAISIKVGIFIR